MQLTTLDWVVIAVYFLVNLAIGFHYYRKASGSVGEFFISGRSVPWWLAGTSMVATTFGADTPLVVTGLVYKYGVAGNWFWWSFALSGMLTVFFFARLWRRAGVLTDMEFAELRYAGEHHHYGLGESGDGEDTDPDSWHHKISRDLDHVGHCCIHPRLRDNFR